MSADREPWELANDDRDDPDLWRKQQVEDEIAADQ